MESYTLFFIANVFLLSSHGVFSTGPKTCDPTDLDDESCGVHCNSLWGRAPLFNIPWGRGFFHKGDCVCRFNNEKLHKFTAHECVQRSIWSSLRGKKKIAEQGINAKVISMNFRQRFEVFKGAYKKKYGSQAEESKRFAIFKDNLAIIDGLMARRTGNVVFGVGPFTDLTRFEYRAMRGNIKRKSSSTKRLQPRMLRRLSQSRRPDQLGPSGRKGRSLSFGSAADLSRTDSYGSARRSQSVPPPPRSPFPVESRPKPFIGRDPEGNPLVDWRVPANLYPSTEPQNQFGRECNACWAFSTAGAVEILLARARGAMTRLSKQARRTFKDPQGWNRHVADHVGFGLTMHRLRGRTILTFLRQISINDAHTEMLVALIDCVPDSSCDIGDIEEALFYMHEAGVPRAEDYPYGAKTGDYCKSHIPPYVKIGYADVSDVFPESDTLAGHLTDSPIATNIYAPDELQHYVSGVFDVPDCDNNPGRFNHAVVIVGHYKDSWIVRDSSPSSWGLEVCIILL